MKYIFSSRLLYSMAAILVAGLGTANSAFASHGGTNPFPGTVFTPPAQVCEIGVPCSVTVRVEDGTYGTQGIQGFFSFDPSVVEVSGIAAIGPWTMDTVTIDNTTGTAQFKTNVGGGFKGDVVSVTLDAVGEGISGLTWSNVNLYLSGTGWFGSNGTAHGATVEVPGAPDFYFYEDFSGADEGSNLEDPDDAFSVSAGAISNTAGGNPIEDNRYFVRTKRTDYDSVDWIYTIDFDIAGREIIYIGVGAGEADTGWLREPGNSVHFRIHSQSIGSGGIHAMVRSPATTGKHGKWDAIYTVGSLPADGAYTARLEKSGADLLFSIESVTGVTTVAMPAFLDDSNSRLFFGLGGADSTLDNMLVEEPLFIDTDGDGVTDDVDQCPATASGAVIDADGCSGAQLVAGACAEDADYKNHGKYVSCVAKAAEALVGTLLTEEEKDAIVSAAAGSDVGKRKGKK